MSTHSPNRTFGLIRVSLLFISLITDTYCQTPPRPNFVFIIPDDLGFNEVRVRETTNTYTPTIDNLINTGLELSRFYVTAKCAPTRMSLMTGRMPHKIGMQEDIGFTAFMTCGVEPKLENTLFTDRLKHCAQYDNYFLGKYHLGHYKHAYLPIKRGFKYFEGFLGSHIDYYAFTAKGTTDSNGNDLYDWRVNDVYQALDWEASGYTYYSTKEIGKRAVDKINNMDASKPFTLIIAMQAPRGPVHESPDHDALQALNVGLYAPTGDDRRKKINGMIYSMDLQIKDIVDALKDNTHHAAFWPNTLLFFISDNGGGNAGSNYPLRGSKSYNWEGGVRVPAFINGGYLSTSLAGKSYDRPVHITDIFATLMDITGINTNDLQLDGKSFKNVLDSTTPPTTPRTDRNTIILYANNNGCQGSYSGTTPATTVCGGIIKDYGSDGIFKLVIGKDIIGTDDNHGWQELNNQANINAAIPPSTPIFSCNPTNDATLTKPTWNPTTAAAYCSNQNTPCLFDLTVDPCEYRDLSSSTDTSHQAKLSELAQLLITAYNGQVTPFKDRTECFAETNQDITAFWTTFTPSQLAPFANYFDSSIPSDPPVYTDNGVCTAQTWTVNIPGKKRADSKTSCGSGGLLSIPESSGNIDAIKQTLLDNSVSQAWINLKRDPSTSSPNYKYKWDDATPCDSTGGDYCSIYWGANQPDASKKCVLLKDNGNFVTSSCNQLNSYLCDTTTSTAPIFDGNFNEPEHYNLIHVFRENAVILILMFFGILIMAWVLLRLCGYKIQKVQKNVHYYPVSQKGDPDTDCSDVANLIQP